MRAFTYLLRREVWEHRAIWMVPGVAAALMLLATFYATGMALYHHADMVDVNVDLAQLTAAQVATALGGLMVASAMPFDIMLLGVTFFYLLDALYGDRRDRSVLFWKSLPVSDLATVLSKLATALVVVPLVVTGIIAIYQIGMIVSTAVLVGTFGGSGWGVLAHPVTMVAAWFTILLFFVVQALWYFPVYGWLMLASAWARKAPFLWAVVPPLALIFAERIALGSHHFADLIGHHFGHLYTNLFDEQSLQNLSIEYGNSGLQISQQGNPISILRIGHLLENGRLWGGLVIGAVFVAGATWLRRYRDES